MFPNGTLVKWNSWGNTYRGMIVGTCSYDNCGKDNAYVCRYVWKPDYETPRHPFAIVDMKAVEVYGKDDDEWPEDFYIGDHWSRTPPDRCKEWERVKQNDGSYLIVPIQKKEEE